MFAQTTDSSCGCCPCPNLQDCGILVPGGAGGTPGFGTITSDAAESTVVGNSGVQTIPDVLANSATATNVCGLEVSANKSCGDVLKLKTFNISGCI